MNDDSMSASSLDTSKVLIYIYIVSFFYYGL